MSKRSYAGPLATTLAIPPIPIEEVATYPRPGTTIPGELAFSPDGRLVTYLFSREGTLVRQLYALDLETGEEKLVVQPPSDGTSEEEMSLEETLRRERLRQLELGVTQYRWAKKANRILIPMPGGIFIQDGLDAPLRKIAGGGTSPALDAQLSPDGKWVAYVEDAEIYTVPAGGGEPRQITYGARGTGKTHGLAEYIAQEEMERNHGFWWSPDSQWIAFTQVDETGIPEYRIMHQGKETVGPGAQEDHRYPFAGEANARIQLGVVSVQGGEPVWMDLGEDQDIYLARVHWFPDGTLSAQIENREQTSLELVRFVPKTGRRSTLLRETNEVWINLHDMFRPLKGHDGAFIWASERSGFFHLYLYDAAGNLVRPLTQGEWMVDKVIGVDEKAGQVYFMATRDGPTECHLYTAPLTGGDPRRITLEPGFHTIVLDHNFERYIDMHHALDLPPTVAVRSLADSSILQTIYDMPDPRVAEMALEPPELITLENDDGILLYGAIYRPPASFGSGPHPCIVSVYGGPHAQRVANNWFMTADMQAQFFSRLGFLVFKLDNRGSARRGLAFEGVLKHRMGHVELQDQIAGVRWLIDQKLADPKRVGIIGWSYGGYMAAMALARAPEIFKVAVAGAPVSRMENYDTHYTERYMGTPQSNPEGYQQSSVIRYISQITGKLLLIHGLIDENVHFRNTAQLINALISARVPYDLLLFPDERHMPRKLEDRVYMQERIKDYFIQHL